MSIAAKLWRFSRRPDQMREETPHLLLPQEIFSSENGCFHAGWWSPYMRVLEHTGIPAETETAVYRTMIV
jgi:hypothetical protein